MSDRTCTMCAAVFLPTHPKQTVCSPPCDYARQRRAARDHARRSYTPKPSNIEPRPCDHCGESFQPYRESNRYCGRLCQRKARDQRRFGEIRTQFRECMKCGRRNVERKPGFPVCDECKVDKRDRTETERRRRFRTYGITEAEYNAILDRQGHRCGICSTDTPGVKGWAIDHCHESGMVRGVLCSQCNSAIGLLREDPAIIERAAEYVRQHTQLRLVI